MPRGEGVGPAAEVPATLDLERRLARPGAQDLLLAEVELDVVVARTLHGLPGEKRRRAHDCADERAQARRGWDRADDGCARVAGGVAVGDHIAVLDAILEAGIDERAGRARVHDHRRRAASLLGA